jgi:hypothetical protein
MLSKATAALIDSEERPMEITYGWLPCDQLCSAISPGFTAKPCGECWLIRLQLTFKAPQLPDSKTETPAERGEQCTTKNY